jgi:TolB-like protein
VQGKIYLNLFLVFLFVLSGCSSKPGVTVKRFDFNESFTPSSWKKIVVLPFSGEKNFRRTASEWFSFYLQKQQHYAIVTPTLAEIEITNQGMGFPEKGLPIEKARQAARLLEADAVFMGNVETHKRSQSPVKISIQLIDVKTGEQIASHTVGYPSWVFLWDNFQEYVKLATDTAGRDFLKTLEYLADGNRKKPLPENSSPNRDKAPHEI